MDSLILMNKKQQFGEILTDLDYESFKYEYEKNSDRSISFTIFKSSENADIFDTITNEMMLLWKDQYYVIKSTKPIYDGIILRNEIEAKHIFMDFQHHYIDKDLENEELNTDEDDNLKPTYTVEEYIKYIFKGNKIGFKYELIGTFNKRMPLDELGGKNGLEALVEGAELFGYIYFADNKTIYIYDEASFYERSDEPIIYKYNNDDAQVTINTLDLKTIIRGFGKKKTKAETKNYNPIKPKDLSYSGNFIKEGTWRTEQIGASYTKEFECEWGNERLEWTLKKISKGGVLEVFIDNQSKGEFECYSKNAETEKIIIASGLSKGKHTFKVVFKKAKSGVDYKKSAPCMYVGTSKSTVLNLTAVLKGEDVYHTKATYKSPNYESFGRLEAATIYDDEATNYDDLMNTLKNELQDEPVVEIATNYLGSVEDKQYIQNGDIKENSLIRFIHKPMGYNVELKVVKITESHPIIPKPVEVEFSNASKDIIKIQLQESMKIKNMNNFVISERARRTNQIVSTSDYSDSVGSVLIGE
ncbi:phage tail protein [Staphylococcus xylosus]|uniref:prophage endopeptidase tail family protein n=1 Tax=Staphylococcus xylosus TaxID=1288 RepID=UPI001CDBB082|nr:phage tail protein [Staphylococcus xylosus]UBV35732.1 phage tail protein [Staphylococcus xylosus]